MAAKIMCVQRGSERMTVIRKLIRSENGGQKKILLNKLDQTSGSIS